MNPILARGYWELFKAVLRLALCLLSLWFLCRFTWLWFFQDARTVQTLAYGVFSLMAMPKGSESK